MVRTTTRIDFSGSTDAPRLVDVDDALGIPADVRSEPPRYRLEWDADRITLTGLHGETLERIVGGYLGLLDAEAVGFFIVNSLGPKAAELVADAIIAETNERWQRARTEGT